MTQSIKTKEVRGDLAPLSAPSSKLCTQEVVVSAPPEKAQPFLVWVQWEVGGIRGKW